MTSETTTFIKKDAIIPLKIGAGYLQRLQSVLLSLLEGKSDEELAIINEAIESGKTSNLPEAIDIETIMILIKAIEESAINNKLTEERVDPKI